MRLAVTLCGDDVDLMTVASGLIGTVPSCWPRLSWIAIGIDVNIRIEIIPSFKRARRTEKLETVHTNGVTV